MGCLKEFIKKYWKKHLALIVMTLLMTGMMIYLKAYQGMGMFVAMCFICTGYIIIRDTDRFDTELNKRSKRIK